MKLNVTPTHQTHSADYTSRTALSHQTSYSLCPKIWWRILVGCVTSGQNHLYFETGRVDSNKYSVKLCGQITSCKLTSNKCSIEAITCSSCSNALQYVFFLLWLLAYKESTGASHNIRTWPIKINLCLPLPYADANKKTPIWYHAQKISLPDNKPPESKEDNTTFWKKKYTIILHITLLFLWRSQ